MPKIQEYLPETAAEGPSGSAYANLEAVSQFGQGMERLGANVEQGFSVINERRQQAEMSDAAAAVAQHRADAYEQMQYEQNNGTFNLDDFKQREQDWADQQADNYDTAGGKNTFNRLAARSGGGLLRQGVRAQAIVAGNNARQSLTTMLNANSATVEADPTTYHEVADSQTEALQGYVDSGVFSPQQQTEMLKQMHSQLAEASVRGMAKNFDYQAIKNGVINSGADVDIDQPQFNGADKMLNGHALDGTLSSDQVQRLQSENKMVRMAALSEGHRVLNLQQQGQEDAQEQFINKEAAKIWTGTADTNELLNSPLTGEKKLWALKLNQDNAKRQMTETDPVVFNNLTRRIMDPSAPDHIDDPSQLLKYGANGQLTPSGYETLSKLIPQTPQGRVNQQMEKIMFDQAKSTLVHTNPMLGIADPEGETRLALFTQQYMQAKQDALAQGKPVSSILMPSSPNYFGKNIDSFRRPPEQIMSAIANQMRSQSGIAPQVGAPTQISAAPPTQPAQTQPSGQTQVVTTQSRDQEAIDWARNNPKDPRSQTILRMRGMAH